MKTKYFIYTEVNRNIKGVKYPLFIFKAKLYGHDIMVNAKRQIVLTKNEAFKTSNIKEIKQLLNND